jgi:hypothetical protein
MLTRFVVTNNVLDWSKLESDSETVCHPTPLDLRAVSESIVHILPSNEYDAEVEFMVVVTPSVPVTLLLDETYIHRIFMNLLSNALKFTRSGYVLLIIKYNEGNLIAQVKDTGIGIPPAFLPRLFEPFSQAETLGSQRGTGLGLSIIKELLRIMDGDITVESQYHDDVPSPNVHSGTTFTVTIPAQAPSPCHNSSGISNNTKMVAFLPLNNPTIQEGHKTAWEDFDYRVVETTSISELSNYPDVEYIWADAEYLQNNSHCLESLLGQDTRTVLVTYSNEKTLHSLPGLVSSSRFVLLPKPLIWHTFDAQTVLSPLSPTFPAGILSLHHSTIEASLSDASNVQEALSGSVAPKTEITILLVEDNPVHDILFPSQDQHLN